MSRTVSARIPKDLHEELRERCNHIGCTINDYLKASVEFALNGTNEFDFGDEDNKDDLLQITPRSDIMPTDEKFNSHNDQYGNYWTYDKTTKRWTCHLNMNNVTVKP